MLKDFCVDLRMVLGKLLITGIAINIASCSSNPELYYGADTLKRSPKPTNFVHRIMLQSSNNAYDIPAADRERHQRCVFFALDTLDLGEKCDWHNSETGTKGTVKIVRIFSTSSGVCHTFFSTVYKSTTPVSWQDTACFTPQNDWKFVSRY